MKECQQKLIETLLEAEKASDTSRKQLSVAVQLTQEALEVVDAEDALKRGEPVVTRFQP